MKSIISFVVLLVGVSALPQTNKLADLKSSDQRLITDAIASVIEDVSQNIIEAGLDPYHIEREDYRYTLPVPVILDAGAFVEELLFTGLSNIVIEQINFGILASRLTLTLNLPAIEATLGQAAAEAVVFGNGLQASGSGSVKINNVRVAADVRVNVGIVSGISIRSLDVDASLESIESNLNVVVQGIDISFILNNILGETIPNTLREFRAEINELLEIVALEYINDLL